MVNPETLLITTEYVRQALDQLIKTSAKERINPLQYLHLIDEYCLSADFSFFQNPRQFALNEFLVSLIRDQYVHLRSLYDMDAPSIGVSLEVATVIIKQDAVISNPDMLGWAWLYFHYVEDSLHISQQWFCDTVMLGDRTIRRYQNDAIDQLKVRLIQLEQEARKNHRKRILFLRLPHQGNIGVLFERNRELDTMRNSDFRHFYVSGALGVGKTVLVELYLQERIKSDDLDQIIWLQSPETINYVVFYLQEQLLVENTKVTLAEYVSIKRVAIVIDDCEYLINDMPKLEAFLQEFSNANVYLISHIFQTVVGCSQIHLHELSSFGINVLLRHYYPDDQVAENSQYIWQQVGGNPLAIQLLVQSSTIFDIHIATSLTLENVFSDLYQSLQLRERLAWLILALLTNTSNLVDFSEFESPFVSPNDFLKLSRLCIAITSRDDSRITLSRSARRFIELHYKSTSELSLELEHFIQHQNTVKLTESDLTLSLIESILSTSWIHLSFETYTESARRYAGVGIYRGHFAIWQSILSKYAEDGREGFADLSIRYGLCERYLGRWSDAQSVFETAVETAGHTGDFLLQGEALLELAILMRWQGDYEAAAKALDHIDVLVKSNIVLPVRNRLIIEQIEIALEQNQTEVAWALVEQLQELEPRKRVLIVEICARESVPRFSLATIQKWGLDLLMRYENSPSIRARLHILMGRIAEKQKELEGAIKHLSIALSLLTDQDNDPFALARTQTNLASLFIQINQITDAQMLLNSAKNIQLQIGDRVGLATTVHNEHVVQRKIVS